MAPREVGLGRNIYEKGRTRRHLAAYSGPEIVGKKRLIGARPNLRPYLK
jgi:hypothetical protein